MQKFEFIKSKVMNDIICVSNLITNDKRTHGLIKFKTKIWVSVLPIWKSNPENRSETWYDLNQENRKSLDRLVKYI